MLLWLCNSCPSYRKDTTRADHRKTDTSYYPNNGQSLRAKASRPVVKKADVKAKRGYKESFDTRNGTRELPLLQPGEWAKVKLDGEKQWNTEPKVISTDQSPRSYIVDSGGRMLRRNQTSDFFATFDPHCQRQCPLFSISNIHKRIS